MADDFRILVVDDEPAQRELVCGFLRKQGLEAIPAESGEQGLEIFRQQPFDLLLTDQKMPKLSGLDLLKSVRAINPETSVIVMTAYGKIESAVAAIKEGATDYLTKPLNLDELLHKIEQVRERHRLYVENRELREALQSRHRIEGVLGESGQMLEVTSLVRRVAPSEATVLIRGESGTGKELIAKAIHYASPRAGAPLIRVNCAALPETLLESELFGHEKGAFTGAVAKRKGRFELAAGAASFSMRSATFPCPSRPSFCAFFRSGNSSGWARACRSASTCAFSPPPIGISKGSSRPGSSARTFTTGSTWSRYSSLP